jgi:hypothetical protein
MTSKKNNEIELEKRFEYLLKRISLGDDTAIKELEILINSNKYLKGLMKKLLHRKVDLLEMPSDKLNNSILKGLLNVTSARAWKITK